MDELDALLSELPDKERLDILADYTEHFLHGIQEGKNEHEIAEALGSPKLVARELLAGYRIHQAQSNATVGNMSRAVIATVSLGFFNLIFVLGPLLALLGVLVACFCAAVSLLVAPLGLIAQFGIPTLSQERLLLLFTSLTSVGLGGMLTIGMFCLTRWMYRVGEAPDEELDRIQFTSDVRADGTLRVQVRKQPRMRLSFMGDGHLQVQVLLPEAVYEKINPDTETGDIKSEAIQAKQASMTSSTGDFDLAGRVSWRPAVDPDRDRRHVADRCACGPCGGEQHRRCEQARADRAVARCRDTHGHGRCAHFRCPKAC